MAASEKYADFDSLLVYLHGQSNTRPLSLGSLAKLVRVFHLQKSLGQVGKRTTQARYIPSPDV